MQKLGLKYHPRRRCYYIDSNESEENMRYFKHFIAQYFTYELCAYRWYSITKVERDKLVRLGVLQKTICYHYKKDDIDMVEFHIHDHILFQSR